MARWRWAVPLWFAAQACFSAGCSLLVDSDVGVRSDGGGAGGGDAAAGGDGAAGASDAPDSCPDLLDLAPFSDDFADDEMTWAIDPKIQRDGAAAMEAGVSAGVLHFVPGAQGNDSAWAKSEEFEFLEGRVAVRVPTLTTDSDAEAYVALLAPGVDHRMRYNGDTLRVPGGTAVTYASDAHRWWQIRSEDFYLHFETSMDGVTWSELDSIPADIDPLQVRIQIGITVAVAGAASRGEFAIDDLNLPPCR